MRLARRVAESFGTLANVEAVAMGGSQATGQARGDSDVDMYVYTTGEVALSDREAVVSELGTVNAELNQAFWEVADGWHDAETGVEVEAVYWRTSWIEKMLDHVLVHHRPSNGYSTAHWHTIRHSVCLQDRNGWFAALQQRSRQPYPEQLQRAIIAWNHPVLGTVTHSYASQIRHAVQRGDSVSINHRLTELLASYFDVLFALNRMTHPGEKRLLDLAAEQCAMVPANMRTQVEAVLRGVPSGGQTLLDAIDELLDGLDRLLRREGFLTS